MSNTGHEVPVNLAQEQGGQIGEPSRRDFLFLWRQRSAHTGQRLIESSTSSDGNNDEAKTPPAKKEMLPGKGELSTKLTISRRVFLVLVGAAGATASAAVLHEKFRWLGRFIPEKQESKERLDSSPRNILVIDFPTGNGEGIPEEGLTDYAKIEQGVFAGMPDRFLPRSELIALLNQQSGRYELRDLDNPSPMLLRNIAELGYPDLAAWYAFLKRFRTHGQLVAAAAETSWQVTSESGEQRLLSLGEFLSEDTIDFQQDRWGNTGIAIQLRAEQVIPRITQYLREHQDFLDDGVVNLSLQMGKIESWVGFKTADEMFPNLPTLRGYIVGELDLSLIVPQADIENIFTPYLTVVSEDDGKYVVRHEDPDYPEYTKEYVAFAQENSQDAYDEVNRARAQYRQELPEEALNPGTHDVGAYTGEDRAKNIQELVDVARAFPELFFCAAAGNNADDLTGLQELGVEIPQNLMLVGQWSTSTVPPRPAFETKGAEIYVENDVPAELLGGETGNEVELGSGSSFSTPQIAGIASTLRGLGISIDQVKPLILEMTEVARYPVDRGQEGDEPSEEVRVLSLQRVQEVVTALRGQELNPAE